MRYIGQFHGLEAGSSHEREAASPNALLAPGSLGRSRGKDPGDGVGELEAVEGSRTCPKYGLYFEIVASFCESFATHVDLPKEK